MSDIAIKIENLKKKYKLGTIGGETLTADIESWWARKRGYEDPNLKLGIDQNQSGRSFYALNGIDIEIKKGEALGIIGANGAGKSTLLKILSRVTAPTEGKIGINGRVTSMLEVGTGFHPELTGRENIYMNGAILGMTRKEIAAKVNDIIEFSECGMFIDTPVKRYSSGMYVKLAFSVAAHLDSDIMIMDEVLAVGDMKFQKKCLGSMNDATNREGKTVLYVSHNMNTIRQLCSRCVVLEHGRIIYDGDVEEAISIYSGIQDSELKSLYDFTQTKRPSYDHGKVLFVEEICFLDKEKAMYYQDENAKVKIKWRANKKVQGVRFMLCICYLDDTVIGCMQSDEVVDAEENVEYETFLELNFSNIREGNYYFYVDIISLNQYGTHIGYDRPLDKVFFEVLQSPSYRGIVWVRQGLGSVDLQPIASIGTNIINEDN